MSVSTVRKINTFTNRTTASAVHTLPSIFIPSEQSLSLSSLSDQVRNSYYIGADGSLRLLLANGMEVALQTEPHLLAGTVNPTVGKRNVTLPIDNGLNLVEWRQRKEQARGQVTVFGRRLRVSKASNQVFASGGRVLGRKSEDKPGELGSVLEIVPGGAGFLGPQFLHLPKGGSKVGNSWSKSLVQLFSRYLWKDYWLWYQSGLIVLPASIILLSGFGQIHSLLKP